LFSHLSLCFVTYGNISSIINRQSQYQKTEKMSFLRRKEEEKNFGMIEVTNILRAVSFANLVLPQINAEVDAHGILLPRG
jgi:hypothetical protein